MSIVIRSIRPTLTHLVRVRIRAEYLGHASRVDNDTVCLLSGPSHPWIVKHRHHQATSRYHALRGRSTWPTHRELSNIRDLVAILGVASISNKRKPTPILDPRENIVEVSAKDCETGEHEDSVRMEPKDKLLVGVQLLFADDLDAKELVHEPPNAGRAQGFPHVSLASFLGPAQERRQIQSHHCNRNVVKTSLQTQNTVKH